MNRNLLRFVTIILVPCLMVDPIMASAGPVGAGHRACPKCGSIDWNRMPITGGDSAPPLQFPFTSQALALQHAQRNPIVMEAEARVARQAGVAPAAPVAMQSEINPIASGGLWPDWMKKQAIAAEEILEDGSLMSGDEVASPAMLVQAQDIDSFVQGLDGTPVRMVRLKDGHLLGDLGMEEILLLRADEDQMENFWITSRIHVTCPCLIIRGRDREKAVLAVMHLEPEPDQIGRQIQGVVQRLRDTGVSDMQAFFLYNEGELDREGPWDLPASIKEAMHSLSEVIAGAACIPTHRHDGVYDYYANFLVSWNGVVGVRYVKNPADLLPSRVHVVIPILFPSLPDSPVNQVHTLGVTLARPGSGPGSQNDALSARQRRVLARIGMGWSDKEIATEEPIISESTVKAEIGAIRRKPGMADPASTEDSGISRFRLIQMAHRLGAVPNLENEAPGLLDGIEECASSAFSQDEKAVFELIKEGLAQADIVTQMGIPLSMVKLHTRRMGAKLNDNDKVKDNRGQYKITPRVAAAFLAHYRPKRNTDQGPAPVPAESIESRQGSEPKASRTGRSQSGRGLQLQDLSERPLGLDFSRLSFDDLKYAAEFVGPLPSDLIVFRGYQYPSSSVEQNGFLSRTAARLGVEGSKDVLAELVQQFGLERVVYAHASGILRGDAMTRLGDPFVVVTLSLGEALGFSGAGNVFAIRLPAGTEVIDRSIFDENLILIPHRIPPEWIIHKIPADLAVQIQDSINAALGLDRAGRPHPITSMPSYAELVLHLFEQAQVQGDVRRAVHESAVPRGLLQQLRADLSGAA